MKSNNALIVILGTVTLDAVGIGLVMPVLPGLLRDIVHSDSIASHYGVLLALLCVDAISMRTRSRSTVRPLWPPPSPARFATWSHYRLRDHGDHTRPVDPLRRTHRGRHHRRHRCGCWRLYRRHHRWGRSARHFGPMSACFGVGMVAGPVAGDCWAPSPCMHHSLRRRCSTASTYYWAAS